MQVPFTASDNRLAVLRGIIRGERGYVMGYEISDFFIAIIGMTEKYFPKAQVNTWTASLYEGVYEFHSGIAKETTWMQNAILENWFEEKEKGELLAKKAKNWQSFCESLEAKFPEQMKTWASTRL